MADDRALGRRSQRVLPGPGDLVVGLNKRLGNLEQEQARLRRLLVLVIVMNVAASGPGVLTAVESLGRILGTHP